MRLKLLTKFVACGIVKATYDRLTTSRACKQCVFSRRSGRLTNTRLFTRLKLAAKKEKRDNRERWTVLFPTGTGSAWGPLEAQCPGERSRSSM